MGACDKEDSGIPGGWGAWGWDLGVAGEAGVAAEMLGKDQGQEGSVWAGLLRGLVPARLCRLP